MALVVDKTCKVSEQKHHDEVKISRGAVQTIAKVVMEIAGIMSEDLIMFANHGKRAVISSDDVKLCARKSPKLLRELEKYEVEEIGIVKERRKKDVEERRNKKMAKASSKAAKSKESEVEEESRKPGKRKKPSISSSKSSVASEPKMLQRRSGRPALDSSDEEQEEESDSSLDSDLDLSRKRGPKSARQDKPQSVMARIAALSSDSEDD